MSNKNVPQIRFKGFEGEWEEKKLGECFSERLDRSAEGELISVTINSGIRKFSELGRHDNSSEDKSNYKCVHIGDIAYNSMRMWQGASGYSKYDGIVSPAYTVLVPKTDVDSLMFSYLFKRKEAITLFKLNSQGITSDTWNLKYPTLSNLCIFKPIDISEQTRIASLFTAIDKQISCSEAKLDKLRTVKKTLLKKMFASQGEKTPQIRFKGFDGAWEEKKFSKITYSAGKKNKDNIPLESYSITNENGFIPQNEQFEKGGNMTTADKSMYYIVEKDSFAYNPARINVGSIGYYNGNKDVIVSSLYEVFKTTAEVNDRFLWHWLKSNHFYKKILQFQEGGVRLYFYYDKLCMCSMYMPTPNEQEKVGNLLDSLDKQISLQEQKIEKLKAVKKTLLKKMFV